MHIFVSAGEPSGDLHGANLIRALRRLDPNVRVVGFGGDRMRDAGCELLYPLCSLAVMWFLRVLLNIFTFMRLLKQAKRYFHEQKPDAIILIDYPGFHFALAKRAHAAGIPVYYFVPPQLWAWAGWRVKKMRRWVDHVLCALPFEEPWYRQRGAAARYVGHPYFDELPDQRIDADFVREQRERPGEVVGILPGSRMQEVLRNFPMMLEAAARIHAARPGTRFLVASFNEEQAALAREQLRGRNLPVEIYVGRTPEIIELASACVAVSGSVGLELMYRLKPTAVAYRIRWLDLRVSRLFIKCRFISLVNLLADAELYPEFLTDHDESEAIAARVLNWLNNPSAAEGLRTRLRELRDRVAEPGACDRAARFVVARVAERATPGKGKEAA